ncbi:MAG: FRG domain-containing protein [Cohaesibacteraceae bacterium]|nr:FRG domain-containing protein [Cohaesibacteraceae bacterium]MBL4876385.1 FRG domain-containing protein [Cohaesibacteraceae bacterium]
MSVYTYRIKNVTDFFLISQKFENYVFRGQQNANWSLESKLERDGRQFGFSNLEIYERLILNKFKTNLNLFSHSVGPFTEDVDWLALVQHHGGPTRLLDFTQSLFIALHFADVIEKSDSVQNQEFDAAIWAFNLDGFNQANESELYRDYGRKLVRMSPNDQLFDHNYKMAVRCFRGGMFGPNILVVRPRLGNQRLLIQQGIFLMPTDLNESFLQNLQEIENTKLGNDLMGTDDIQENRVEDLEGFLGIKRPIYTKILIPNSKELRNDIMLMLGKMNITDATMFPGLDGFAKSLRNDLEFFEPIYRNQTE